MQQGRAPILEKQDDGCFPLSRKAKVQSGMRHINFDTRQYLAPCGPEVFIRRPRLGALYGKARKGGYVIVSAPAGFGKTVTTSHWARESGRVVAWLTVDRYDNDPGTFYELLCNTVISVQPDNERMQKILLDPLFPSAPVEYAIRLLAAFKDDGREFVLVLDDVHSITNSRILTSLPHLFRRLPQSFLIVLITRDSRGEPYAQFKKDGAIIINSRDLCFTEDELQMYFRAVGSQAASLEIGDIHHTTGGWPIGVVALAAMHSLEEPVSGADLIERYFAAHWWPRLDARMKRFILMSAATDEMSADLSRHLTGYDDSEEMLAHLHANSYFMTQRLDGAFFFHRIILDLVRETPEFAAQDLDKLYTLAAEFYKSRKEFSKARHCAHLSRNVQTILRNGFPSIFDDFNSFEALKNCADSNLQELVPEDLCEKAPFLYITNAAITFLSASPELFGYYMDKMYKNWETIAGEYPQAIWRYYLMSLRDHRRPYSEICEWAEENSLKERLRGVDILGRSTITCNMPHMHRGPFDFSEFVDKRALHRCMRINRVLSQSPGSVDAYYRSIEAGLLFEQHRLEEALAVALCNISELSAGTLHEIRFASMMILASIYEAMDNTGEYVHVMREVEKYINGQYPFLRPNFLALKTDVLLCRGDRDAASGWLENYCIHSTQRLKLYEIPLYFTTLRSLIVLDRLEEAHVLVVMLRKLFTGFRRILDLGSLDVLDSIITWNRGQHSKALDLLAGAMRRMQPFGFVMPVAVEGAAVAPVLTRLLKGKTNAERGLDPRYVQTVQIHVAQRARKRKGIACRLSQGPRKLSKQQQMTLRMFAEGKSIKEAAQTMGLTIHTVKWHSKETYAKLRVNNVADAITKARSLGYID